MAASTVRVNRPAPRIRAPELRGRGGWLNTAGPLSLVDLRGRFVLVDFWTSCCVNCLHALDELRPVEERFADCLTVVAVHSPKFPHEREHRTVVDAVERYGITHPVLDDPDLRTWDAYTARAWPTLVLVDPEGYVTAEYSGEGHAHAIAAMIAAGIDRYAAGGTLRRGPSPADAGEGVRTGLRFPGGAVVLPPAGSAPGPRVLVADTARHALVELAADPVTGALTTEIRRIGSGVRGLVDGPAAAAGFAEPQGLCLLPAPVAAQVGYDVVVADTVDHALRGVRLSDGAVRTLAGGTGSGGTGLSSPWAVAWWRDRIWIALAGTHQLGTFDPLTGEVARVAGTTQEGLRDGELSRAWFAQPSALAVDPVADRLWVLDAESSALRVVCDDPDLPDPPTGRLVVRTVVGTGLFDFGHRDGDLDVALFQHPLGIAVEPGGTVLVADTYNGALRRVDPVAGTVRTVLTGLVEPTAVLVGAPGLVVVESAAHRLTLVDPELRARIVDCEPGIVARSPVLLRPGPVRLDVRFVPPPGQHPDERSGPATALRVVATPPALLRSGAGDGTDLLRDLVLDAEVGDGILHVSARASSCDIDSSEQYPACHLHQQDWGIPVVLAPGGSSELILNLGGDR